MTNLKHKIISCTILCLTFASLFPILFVKLEGYQASFFWIYGISITSFLIFMYAVTSTYKPMSDMGYRPAVSVIIPAKNEEEVIRQTILSILDSDYPIEKLDVVVVDDGSTDKTAQRIFELKNELKNKKNSIERIKVINHERNYGKRIAFANGVKKCKGEIIICIDSDSYVEKDAIKLLVQPFIKKEMMASCGHGKAANKEKNFLTKLQHYWYQEMFYITKGMEAKFGAVTCCSGILAAYRKEMLLPVMNEWLNESFMGNPIHIGDDRQLTNLSLRGLKGIANNDNPYIFSTKDSEVTYQSNAIVYTIVPDKFLLFLKQQLRWKRAWVHGTILAAKFMWKKPFPVPLYFYVYQFLTYVNPVIIFIWVIYRPLNGEWMGTLAFLVGSLYIGALHGLNIWRYDNESSDSIFYRMMFVFVSIFLSIFLIPYAWATIWKGGWVTRCETKEENNNVKTKNELIV